MAAPSQTCQCEKMPEGMAKLLVQLRSAAMRQVAEDGGESAPMAAEGRPEQEPGVYRFALFLPSLEPLPNRIRTTMGM